MPARGTQLSWHSVLITRSVAGKARATREARRCWPGKWRRLGLILRARAIPAKVDCPGRHSSRIDVRRWNSTINAEWWMTLKVSREKFCWVRLIQNREHRTPKFEGPQ